MNTENIKSSFALGFIRGMHHYNHCASDVKNLMKETINFISPYNRKFLKEGRPIKKGNQYYLIEELDGVFELVKNYVPEELNQFCSIVYFSALQDFAKGHKNEIEDIAIDFFDFLINANEALNLRRSRIQENLNLNEEYQKLKKLIHDPEYSKVVEKLIDVRIKQIEEPLRDIENTIKKQWDEISIACTGSTMKDKHCTDETIIDFVNNDFPALKKQREQEKNSSIPKQ